MKKLYLTSLVIFLLSIFFISLSQPAHVNMIINPLAPVIADGPISGRILMLLAFLPFYIFIFLILGIFNGFYEFIIIYLLNYKNIQNKKIFYWNVTQINFFTIIPTIIIFTSASLLIGHFTKNYINPASLIIAETYPFVVEYLLYSRRLPKLLNNKIIKYQISSSRLLLSVFTANLVTLSIPFIFGIFRHWFYF